MEAVRNCIFTALVGAAALAHADHAASQEKEILGLMRSDGIALPLFEWTGGGWTSLAVPTAARPSVAAYQFLDTLGDIRTVEAGDVVRLLDSWVYNDVWGHVTDLPLYPSVEPFHTWHTVGFVLSGSMDAEVFIETESSMSIAVADSLLQANGSIIDPLDSRLLVKTWIAGETETPLTFFEALRSGRACHIVSGWLASEPQTGFGPAIVGSGCEEKGGTPRPRPWLRVWRNAQEFVLVERHGYTGSWWELWRRDGPVEWVRLPPW